MRTSKFVHLKPHCEKFFKQGKSALEVSKLYPEIALRTLKAWHEALVAKGEIEAATEPYISPLAPVLTLIHSSDDDMLLSDIEWCKRQCRKIYDTEFSSGVKLQAVVTFLKALQIESALKQEPLIEAEIVDTRSYSEMSSEELAALYRSKLS